MGAGRGARDRGTWWRWLAWWKVDLAEVRDAAPALRRFGAILAFLAGGLMIWFAAVVMRDDGPSLGLDAVNVLAALLPAAFAAAWLILGGALLGGRRGAGRKLMILGTAEFLAALAMLLAAGWSIWRYDPKNGEALRPFIALAAIGLLLWSVRMHAYYAIFRLEREGSGLAGEETVAGAAPASPRG